ncbi:hypothetical protein PVAND_013876 [Polypedilum vanderplanki]|uniref:Nose resistant-to-fluoxetine protein N-terminal domain-containing protein n=1 Tax=Polypedilum vanderplanki TaxID=319348 RepID=A0A9J6CQQ0_POLVA|nr:hypothetical protein PVAND_013876 [Polypedilum vanderplanki]
MHKLESLFIIFLLTIMNVKCMQTCNADKIFPQNENHSFFVRNHDEIPNATIYEPIINEINVNSLNDSDLPYNVVPEISNYERDFIKVLSKNYLKYFQPFDLSQLSSISIECREHSHKFLKSLINFEFWALKMNDATARFTTSGLLNGNVNQFGDFDQCVNVREPSNEFRGKYCLAYLQPKVPTSLKYTNHLRLLLQSYDAFKSNFDDPGHRVPKWSTINFGVCVPSSCSSQDIEIAIKHFTKVFTNGTGIQLSVRVESEMCHVNDDEWMSKLDIGTKIAIAFCLLLVLFTILSTIYDYETDDKEEQNQLAVSFSIIKNSKSLFSLQRDKNDIRMAHVIRFFNAAMLLVSHKCMAMFYVPYSNRTAMTELLSQKWTVVARAASLYTDPFLMLSGMLTAYSLFGRLQRNGRIDIIREYISRYFRIMPSLAFLIIFCTFILPLLSNGPQWNLVITHHADLCKQYWWRNLLFIHNWFGFSNMCLTHTHHVGIDTELFWTSPFLIIALYKWPKIRMNVIIALGLLSTIARYYVSYAYELSNYVSFGISVNQLFKTADLMYTLPPHRFTVYAMGIILGCFLRKFKETKLSRMQLRVGWYVSTAALLISFLGPAPMGDITYKFNPTHAAIYAAFAPIAWCFFFGWMIFTSQLGYKNKITKILQWRVFLITTRISYAFYLVQFPVFFFNVGRVKSTVQYKFPSTILDFNEILSVLAISIAFTILIELPFNNLKNILIDRKKVARIDQRKCDENLNHAESSIKPKNM